MGPVGPARPFVVCGAEAWAVLSAARCCPRARASEAVAGVGEASFEGSVVGFLPFLRFTQGQLKQVLDQTAEQS